MIKKLISASAALVLMLSAAGCVGIGFSGFDDDNFVSASGDMTTMDFACGDFNKLTIDIAGELYYTAGKSDKVTIELPQDLAQYIEVSTNDSTLVISSTQRYNVNSDQRTPKIYVSAPVLEKLRITGGIEIEEADKITADSFTFEVPGACSGELELDVKDLSVSLSGAGAITLSGTADKAFISTDGAASIEAFDLQTKEADVRLSGIGNVEISCSDTLIADVSGVGGITYKGNPNVKPNIRGIGGITKAD